MKILRTFQTLEKYDNMLFNYNNVKYKLTPNKIDKIIFLANVDLKRRGHANLINQISYIESDNIRHGYLSTLTRIMPYKSISSGRYSIYLTSSEKRVIRKLLRLNDSEFEALYQSELLKNYDLYNNVKVSEFKKYFWKIRSRNRTYGVVKNLNAALWGWITLFQLISLFLYIVWYIYESSKYENSQPLLYFIIILIPIIITVFKKYSILSKVTIFESKILGNDDDTVLTMEKYKMELKKLKKQKKIKRSRV